MNWRNMDFRTIGVTLVVGLLAGGVLVWAVTPAARVAPVSFVPASVPQVQREAMRPEPKNECERNGGYLNYSSGRAICTPFPDDARCRTSGTVWSEQFKRCLFP